MAKRIKEKKENKYTDKGQYYFDKALEYRKTKNYEAALNNLDKALESGFSVSCCLFDKGRVYAESGDNDRALEECSKAVKEDSGNSGIYALTGRVYEYKGNYKQAAVNLIKALDMGFSDDSIHKDLARVYRESGQPDDALKQLQKALLVNRNDWAVYLEISSLYEEKNELEKALNTLVEAGQMFPGNTEINRASGNVYISMNEHAKALNEYKKIVAAGNFDIEILMKTAFLLRGFQRKEESVKYFRQALSLAACGQSEYLKNKIENEIEITLKKTVLRSMPRSLGVNLSSRCDLKCVMCKVREQKWDMPEKTIREVENLFPYLESIFWQGGELFLLNNFEELFLKAASYPNINQIVVTHGLLIDKGWAEKIAKTNSTLLFSIDSVDKKRYEYIRQNAKFKRLIKSIELINIEKNKNKASRKNCSFETGINTVVMKSNCDDLKSVIEFADRYGFDHWHLLPVETITSEENIFFNNNKKYLIKLRDSLEEIYGLAKKSGIIIYNWLPKIKDITDLKQRYSKKPQKKDYREKLDSAEPWYAPTLSCYWPWKHMFLGEIGSVRPHEICNKKEIGNVTEGSLLEIWNGERMRLHRQKIISSTNSGICNSRCIEKAIPKEDLGYTLD